MGLIVNKKYQEKIMALITWTAGRRHKCWLADQEHQICLMFNKLYDLATGAGSAIGSH
jgi:hypothetical protein